MNARFFFAGAFATTLVLDWPCTASADPLAYGDAGAAVDAGTYSITPPYASGSFTTEIAAFPATTTRVVGGYPLASRLLAATGRTVSLQQTFGESQWLPVAVLADTDPDMDPAFLAISSDGETVGLGCGVNKPIYVFPASLLSVASPVVLTTSPGAKSYENLGDYSAAFRGNRYLFVNAGGAELGESYVYAIDTQASVETIIPILDAIPGASAGIAFDAAGDLVTGIGWDQDDSRTGEIKIFDAASIDAALAGNALDYDSTGAVLATGLLSADSLGFDSSGDLDVGGGDVFGSSGHYGYAQVVSAGVVSRVLKNGGPPADASDPDDVVKIQPDPCGNDDWTGITFVPGVDMVLVGADMETSPPNCASVDYSNGPSPAIVYFAPGAPGQNGIPDGVNPSYEPQEFYGPAELSRLVNALDAKTGDANFDPSVDYVADGKIDDSDVAFLKSNWGVAISN